MATCFSIRKTDSFDTTHSPLNTTAAPGEPGHIPADIVIDVGRWWETPAMAVRRGAVFVDADGWLCFPADMHRGDI